MSRISLRFKSIRSLYILGLIVLLASPGAFARMRTCSPFYLRTETGAIINPITGQNASQPYSTRQTCGACHDYDTITKGYHFQQGWDRIRDDFNPGMPWVLSDGMMGKQ